MVMAKPDFDANIVFITLYPPGYRPGCIYGPCGLMQHHKVTLFTLLIEPIQSISPEICSLPGYTPGTVRLTP
jgi:hypothetical protein